MYINKYGFLCVHASRLCTYKHEFRYKKLFSSHRFALCLYVLCSSFRFPRLPLSVCQVPFFSFDINIRYSITRLCCHITFIGYMLSRVLRREWGGMWYLEKRDMCGNLNVNST